MNPKISVVIPAFNTGNFLRGCVESIENQTYDNLELIIVDDGSKDNTPEVISELKSQYSNILSFNTGDKDICVTRNMGLQNITGEYFCFVDSDDRIRPDMIKILYDTMLSTKADVVGCSFSCWTNSGEEEWTELLSRHFEISEPVIYSPKEHLKEQVFGKNNSRCWSKLYKTSVVKGLSFDEETVIGEDLLFLVKLLGRIDSIAELDYPGYCYTQNPGGAMLRPFTPRYMDQIPCWEKVRVEAIKLDPSVENYATKNLLIAIMLVVGKLAELDKKKRDEFKSYLGIAKQKLHEEIKKEEAFKLLPTGYKFKCRLFNIFPSLYLWLYHFHKYI